MTKGIFLIKKPLITEKASFLAEKGQYVFVVDRRATKNEVKKAIHALYKVDVAGVNIVSPTRKNKRYRNLFTQEIGFKKAVVTLKTGQKINLTP